MKPFDDPEASRKLPADVLAYVAEVEARRPLANVAQDGNGWAPMTYNVWLNVPAERATISYGWTREQADQLARLINEYARADVPKLIAIVREQGALLETALVAADVAATALEMCAAENDSLRNSRIALEEQAWRISEERDVLRECLDGKTAEWMRAQSALDSEKESHRRTILELGLARERLAMAEQTKGELCALCNWAMKFPDEPCRCELEKENKTLRERLAKLETTNAGPSELDIMDARAGQFGY